LVGGGGGKKSSNDTSYKGKRKEHSFLKGKKSDTPSQSEENVLTGGKRGGKRENDILLFPARAKRRKERSFIPLNTLQEQRKREGGMEGKPTLRILPPSKRGKKGRRKGGTKSPRAPQGREKGKVPANSIRSEKRKDIAAFWRAIWGKGRLHF